jgi:hypothetical protein
LVRSIQSDSSTPWNFVYSDTSLAHPESFNGELEVSLSEIRGAPQHCGNLTRESVTLYIDKYTTRSALQGNPKESAEFFSQCAHAHGMEKLLESVKTRYAIFLSSDFFIFLPDWINRITTHMSQRDLAIFGAPWNPRYFQKPRGLPSTNFLIVDLSKVQPVSGDFAPDWLCQHLFRSQLWSEFHQSSSRLGRYSSLLLNPLRVIAEDLRQRKSIGTSKESGFRLWARLGASIRKECITPTFNPYIETLIPCSQPPLFLLRRLDRFYPERYRYFPREWVTTYLGLGDAELPATRKRGWEEFCWRGNPFAAHMNSAQYLDKSGYVSVKYPRRMLSQAFEWLRLPTFEHMSKTFASQLDRIVTASEPS